MIHYHGLPITPDTVALAAIRGGHAFVSFAYPGQLDLAMSVTQSFAIDNGAFSAWKSGKPIKDWSAYYAFVKDIYRHPGFDFAVIPDSIDGDDHENDDLVNQWPWRLTNPWIGAPVWHLHESTNRLFRLAHEFPRVCIGSSGEYATIGTRKWWARMCKAMESVTELGRPISKLHGLRMLDPAVYTRFPFSSADSTNIARNVGIDSRWTQAYPPPTKESRAALMRDRIEAHNSAGQWDGGKNNPEAGQLLLF